MPRVTIGGKTYHPDELGPDGKPIVKPKAAPAAAPRAPKAQHTGGGWWVLPDGRKVHGASKVPKKYRPKG